MNGKTALYARVSSEQQAREGTIESQIEALRAYIAAQGWEIEGGSEYIDNGKSGMQLERAGLEELRDRIAGKQYQRVVVLSRDRLSRDFIHQEYLREEWEKAGCELVYVQETKAETPEELLASRVRGIFAEYERFALLERTRRGQLYRARQGEPVGSAPWGYRYVASEGRVGARWEVEAEEAHWVKVVYGWIGQEHVAIREVARRLNQAGVAPRGGGAGWRESSVHRMLKNPAYHGETYYHRSSRKHGKQSAGGWQVIRPESEWVKIAVPALVSENEWQMVGEELERHRVISQRHATPRRYLLQGLLKCGKCGHTLSGRMQSGHVYYLCRRKQDVIAAERCSGGWNRADGLEEQVWQAVLELIMTPEQVFASYQEQKQQWLSGESEQERQAMLLEGERWSKQWERMVVAYRREVISLEELEQVRRQKEVAEQDLHRRQQLWEKSQVEVAGFTSALAQLETYRNIIQTSLDDLTFEQKREILTLLLEEVLVYKDKLVIRHILPALAPLCSAHQRGRG